MFSCEWLQATGAISSTICQAAGACASVNSLKQVLSLYCLSRPWSQMSSGFLGTATLSSNLQETVINHIVNVTLSVDTSGFPANKKTLGFWPIQLLNFFFIKWEIDSSSLKTYGSGSHTSFQSSREFNHAKYTSLICYCNVIWYQPKLRTCAHTP